MSTILCTKAVNFCNLIGFMKIVLKGASAEIVEKKSRFIATAEPVHTPEEAEAFLARIRKQYWDARHNCSAMIIGEHDEYTRCSDDGEPSGTAGRPMLSVLTGADVHDVCVVVTRYFGGILLGTGGLVRAYSSAVQAGLAACTIAERIDGFRLRIKADYNSIGKIRYLLDQRTLPVTDSIYAQDVELETVLSADLLETVKKEITEKTNAKAQFLSQDPVRFACADGTVRFL